MGILTLLAKVSNSFYHRNNYADPEPLRVIQIDNVSVKERVDYQIPQFLSGFLTCQSHFTSTFELFLVERSATSLLVFFTSFLLHLLLLFQLMLGSDQL